MVDVTTTNFRSNEFFDGLVSSSKPKAQVSFLIKICPLSVHGVVVVNFSHFHLLLQYYSRPI